VRLAALSSPGIAGGPQWTVAAPREPACGEREEGTSTSALDLLIYLD
jgi:hypothetical protein